MVSCGSITVLKSPAIIIFVESFNREKNRRYWDQRCWCVCILCYSLI